MSEQDQRVRVHVKTPGARAGVPYDLSVETIDARELSGDEIEAEVQAAMWAYDAAKAAMDERTKPADPDLLPALTASVEQAKRKEARDD